MQKELFWVPAVAVLLLFFAGGVYSQLAVNQAAQESVGRGTEYVSSQWHFGSELLVLKLIQDKYPTSGFSETISTNISDLDDFHTPLKQFLSGEQITIGSFSTSTQESLFYSDFINYFSCQPLSQEWIDSLVGLSDDGSEFGLYKSSHALLLLSLIKKDYLGGRCGDHSAFLSPLDQAIQSKIIETQVGLQNKDNFDAWIERVAVLGYAGASVSSEDIQFIIEQQSPDGGWRGMLHYELEDTNPHTTAWALFALLEANE